MKKSLFIALLMLHGSSCLAVEVGQTILSCPALTKDIDPSIYKGRVVLIDFWATWCPPCIKSMPFLSALRNELQESGFEILAINVDEETDTARQFLETHPVSYPSAFDSAGKCPEIFQIKAMPSSYLLDKSGKVRKVFQGYRDEDQASIRDNVKALLAE